MVGVAEPIVEALKVRRKLEHAFHLALIHLHALKRPHTRF